MSQLLRAHDGDASEGDRLIDPDAIQHINLKIFVKDAGAIHPADAVAVFHRWIKDSVCPEMLIDVADYEHVSAGPGVLLIAHEANYNGVPVRYEPSSWFWDKGVLVFPNDMNESSVRATLVKIGKGGEALPLDGNQEDGYSVAVSDLDSTAPDLVEEAKAEQQKEVIDLKAVPVQASCALFRISYVAMKWTFLLGAAVSVFALVGCNGGDSGSQAGATSGEVGAPKPADTTKPTTTLKVALLTPGEVSDSGWNALAYNGLQAVKTDLHADVSNKVSSGSNIKEDMRSYAQQGYNLVFGHGFEYNQPAMEVAKDFPKTVFVSSSGGGTAANVGAFRFYLEEGFYLAGMMAAKMCPAAAPPRRESERRGSGCRRNRAESQRELERLKPISPTRMMSHESDRRLFHELLRSRWRLDGRRTARARLVWSTWNWRSAAIISAVW